MEGFYTTVGGNENNKSNGTGNIHNNSSAGGGMEGASANVSGGGNSAAGVNAALMPRKASKSGLEVSTNNNIVNENVHHVIRTDGDDDDLEVVEIDLRH